MGPATATEAIAAMARVSAVFFMDLGNDGFLSVLSQQWHLLKNLINLNYQIVKTNVSGLGWVESHAKVMEAHSVSPCRCELRFDGFR